MNKTPPARELLVPDKSGDARAGAGLRVLHVVSGLGPGGAETVLFRLATQPNAIAHEVICLGPRDWYSGLLEERGIPVHHIDSASPFTAAARVLHLRDLIKKSDPDVVQGWMYRGNVIGGLAARMAGKPVVWNIRCSTFNLLPPVTRAAAYVGGVLARWVPRHIINCSSVSRQLHRRIGYDSVEGSVIPNGYDPAAFYPDEEARAATRRSLGIEAETFLVGSIGRWDPQKGYRVLLRALRRLRDRGIPLRLLLVGKGLDLSNAELARIIEQSGCGDMVQAIGLRADVAAIARSLDLHALASLTEGFPNVVAETMLSGTPNVATDVGDSKLIVGDTGWTVAARDAEKLAAAIEQAYAEWARSPAQWRERRAAARQRIVDRFSLDRMVEAYEQVWRHIAPHAAERRPRPAPVADAKPPLRILHIINDLSVGGAETLLYRLTTRDRTNQHAVVSLGPARWYSALLQEQGIELHHLGMTSLFHAPKAALQLRRIIRDSGADVVHCWMYRSNVFGGIVAKAAGKEVVWGIHSSSFKPLKRFSRALVHFSGWLARWTPDFIVNCSSRSAELHRKIGYSAADGAVVPNGYDASAFFPDETARHMTRKALGIGPREFAVGAIARWDRLKDIPNLIAAVRLARDRGVELRCFQVGSGLTPDNAELMREIERAGCSDIVVPLGLRPDVSDIARALDVHLLGSRTEAFPNVVAETMLSGTPNIVTDVGDCALMIGNTGWLVPPGNPDRLADAIVQAYRMWKDKPGEWAARRNAAREWISANFSLDRMTEAYDQVWRRVAAREVQPDLKPTAVQ